MSWVYVDRTGNKDPHWAVYASRAEAATDPDERARFARGADAARCTATRDGDRCVLDAHDSGRGHEL